jgi:hypothetical protein
MSSFLDILTEVLDTSQAEEQLKNIETSLNKVAKEDETKKEVLNTVPVQIKGLKDWIEQQKKLDTKFNKLGNGVGTQTSLTAKEPSTLSNLLKPTTAPSLVAKVTEKPVVDTSTKLKPPNTAQPTSITKIRKI